MANEKKDIAKAEEKTKSVEAEQVSKSVKGGKQKADDVPKHSALSKSERLKKSTIVILSILLAFIVVGVCLIVVVYVV